jgi:hypothetical protein
MKKKKKLSVLFLNNTTLSRYGRCYTCKSCNLLHGECKMKR